MLAVDVNVKMKNQVRRATKKVSIAFRRSSISEYFWGGQMKDSAEFTAVCKEHGTPAEFCPIRIFLELVN